MYQKNYGNDEIFVCNDPILNEGFKSIYLFVRPTAFTYKY